ncbi:hypothetical protein F4677DRAFT_447687 [Hypoxylon crocopeplum]|nr:hypothetical protein F4677DRAFT_447687 [Hypoxylon crocopeplum]
MSDLDDESLDDESQEDLSCEDFMKLELSKALDSIYPESDFAYFAAIERRDPEIFVRTTDQFEIRSPAWQGFLDTVLANVGKQLQIPSPISAELYKMLLYEQGAVFQYYSDTEDIPGMFGTLVISLPSSHEGGDVVVTHCGLTKTFQTSRHAMACAFWYSDVSHRVLTVKSGYRWVLTYNLAITSSTELPLADNFGEERQELRRVLQSWSQEVTSSLRPPLPFLHAFYHKYTGAHISYQGLKATDRYRVQYLRQICAELNFDLFLTTLEREESGMTQPDGYDWYYHDRYGPFDRGDDEADYHPLGKVSDVSHRLKHVFDLSGNKLLSNVPFDEDNILQQHPFEDEPDEEAYGGYMGGNWGPPATHWYRLSALIIVPGDGILSFLCPRSSDSTKYYSYHMSSGTASFWGLCNYFITQCMDAPGSRRPLELLHEFLSANGDSSKLLEKLTKDHLLKVIQISIHRREGGLLDLIMSKNNHPPPAEFFNWAKEEYNRSVISIDDYKKLFLHAVRLQPTLCQQYDAISTINGDVEPINKIQDIVSEAVNSCLRDCNTRDLQEEDGPAVFDLSLYHRDFSYLKTSVLPIVEKRISSTAFILGFLKALHQSMKCHQIPADEGRPIYEHIAQLALQSLQLTSLTADMNFLTRNKTVEKPSRLGQRSASVVSRSRIPIPKPSTSATNYISYNSMLRFISSLVDLKLEKHLGLLAEKVGSQVKQVKGQEFGLFWIPVLSGLLAILKKHKINLRTPPRWMQMYQSSFQAYLKNYVRDKPSKATFPDQLVCCSCRDCTSLNQFLADPNEKVGRFPMSKDRRAHLQSRIEYAKIDCTHKKEHWGNPHTLVVTKTTSQLDSSLDSWWQRRVQAENQLEAFDQDMLRTVLDDKFDEIMSMKSLEPKEQPVASNASASSPQGHRPPPTAVSSNPAAQLARLDAEISQLVGPSSSTPSTSHAAPPAPAPHSRAPGSTPQQTRPKRSMAEVSRAISETTRRRATPSQEQSTSTSRPAPAPAPGGSSGAGTRGGAPSRPTTTIPNPIAGAKRKYIDVIDLTGDD